MSLRVRLSRFISRLLRRRPKLHVGAPPEKLALPADKLLLSRASRWSAREEALRVAERMKDLGAVREALGAAFKESREVSHFLAIARIAGRKGHLGYQDAGITEAFKLATTRQDYVAIALAAEEIGWFGRAETAVSKALAFDADKAPAVLFQEAIKLARQFKDLSPVNAGLAVAKKNARTHEEFLTIVQTAFSKGQHGYQEFGIEQAWALSKTRAELLRFAEVAEATGWLGYAAGAVKKAFQR